MSLIAISQRRPIKSKEKERSFQRCRKVYSPEKEYEVIKANQVSNM